MISEGKIQDIQKNIEHDSQSAEALQDITCNPSKKTDKLLLLAEQHLPFLSLAFFVLGVGLGILFAPFSALVNNLMEMFIDSYSYFAPGVIYFVLTPMLVKLFSLSRVSERKFAVHTIIWFAEARILACLFAVVAVSLVFGLPLYASDVSGFGNTLSKSFQIFMRMFNSPYFLAFYASAVTGLISMKYRRMGDFAVKGIEAVEYIGRIIVPLIPLFMLAVGGYITTIPDMIGQIMGDGTVSSQIGSVTMFGMTIDVTKPLGMIFVYIFGAFLTGIVCSIWHCGLLVLTKMSSPEFSLKRYFSVYFIKIYPLLWATSSEALSTPLNLYLVKKLCPDIRAEVRHFVVGTGSILNINGTMINVFIMTAIVSDMLGIPLSFMQLLLSIPVVFLLGYGVPGIPGELVLFAGTMALCAGVSPVLTPIFLSLYIGLQVGLPDSFRTAANSTDECLSTIILNSKYKDKTD
ncbi:MAG: hypothetical protein D3920_02605 [Candidatus Electrothrix sp. AW2]|nr:hypothetical protein [Candidatus Electrothrix gigas]